jgi:NAD(P)-dependent dehydrogenase (short-subunit alcohol dehydrogenase family)
MVAEVTAELGAIDILVNCAASVNTGPMRDEDLDDEINVKVKGYLRCARLCPRDGSARLGANHQHQRSRDTPDGLGGRLGTCGRAIVCPPG